MVLQDLGAQVIKVEAPVSGDDARHYGPFLDRDGLKSAYFMSVNCGKESIGLDLKQEAGKQILRELIAKSDVLIENFRPGTLARLGFSDTQIRALNPAMVFASASGFGYSGPESSKAAYDMIIQALSGLMSITGTEEGQTVRVGSSIADIVTGMYTAIGILAALYRRSSSATGARIDVAMLDSTVSILENAIARYQASGTPPRPLGSRHPSITPFESFRTRDGEIIIAAGNDKLFASLCRIIGRPELTRDQRFSTNSDRTENFKALRDIINAALGAQTTRWWIDALSANHIPCAKVNTTADLFSNAQLQARNMLVPVEGEPGFKVAGNPVKFMGEEDVTCKGKAPDLGEHNGRILEEILGYSAQTVAELHAAGVLYQAPGCSSG
jgi:CoA:oxalate CoA-transferase